MRKTCLFCGSEFEAERKTRKYCSFGHYVKQLRKDFGLDARGIRFRKELMRTGAHGDDSVLKIVRAIDQAGAPEHELEVLIDDLLREIASTKDEIKERHKRITKRRLSTVRKTINEARKKNRRVKERWENL